MGNDECPLTLDDAGGVLGHAYFPDSSGTCREIHLDINERWYFGNNPNIPKNQTSFLMVLVHEIGHALGIAHSASPNAIMFAFYQHEIRGLDVDDINAVQYLYGRKNKYDSIPTSTTASAIPKTTTTIRSTTPESSEDEGLIETDNTANHSWRETCDTMSNIPFVKDNKKKLVIRRVNGTVERKTYFPTVIKNKRHKCGIKLYMLMEPNGLILQMLVYTGQLDTIGGKGHSQKVVLELLRGKLLHGHSIYMDNFYNSFELAKTLLQQKTFCTGNLRTDRKGAPQDVVKAKLGKGQHKAQYLDSIMIGKWKDKRDVTYISTEFKNEMVLVKNRRGQEMEKPLPIVKYNECMGGVDRQGQLMSYYPAQRKTLRWYKKLGIHVIHLLLQNSHILYNKFSGKKLSYYDFRLAVLEKLTPAEETVKIQNDDLTKSTNLHANKVGNGHVIIPPLRYKDSDDLTPKMIWSVNNYEIDFPEDTMALDLNNTEINLW
ncbi:unnamed protein product [Acanthoscelides obtectus]|uniref:Uncharacterized protein n=1 Tax=Acanthoscelides obtectus TaxID=200917 RepID=A0A9P0LW53_ACAOB|nr:unnamed protein product [Acanthoscelides obtectus]CAK1641068.1 PiggyBac transposable element-derived protein 4 [Acanthoscelides obtectus]